MTSSFCPQASGLSHMTSRMSDPAWRVGAKRRGGVKAAIQHHPTPPAFAALRLLPPFCSVAFMPILFQNNFAISLLVYRGLARMGRKGSPGNCTALRLAETTNFRTMNSCAGTMIRITGEHGLALGRLS
jgi:hypothetical protein